VQAGLKSTLWLILEEEEEEEHTYCAAKRAGFCQTARLASSMRERVTFA
jgi:hypothetical protein